MKKYTSFIIVIIFLGIIFWVSTLAPKKTEILDNDQNLIVKEVKDYKNTSYVVNGEVVTLVNGMSEVEIAPGSASKKITKYWGGDFHKDLNADGREDVIFILTEDSGGSGLFYYLVASMNFREGYRGSQAFFLGDRIAIQNIEMGDEATILVNYAERQPGQSFDAVPSFTRSSWFFFDPISMSFGEIAPDFDL